MPLDLDAIVDKHIKQFVDRRRSKIAELELDELLRKKNPYLFIARRTDTPEELAEELVAAALSSSEETNFGTTLEGIAIDICAYAFGGSKSPATGIDLEFTRDSKRYIVAIKSGPKWGNSAQVTKMKQDFAKAIQLIRQHDGDVDVRAVNGCCYGRGTNDTGQYVKMCGAPFWELVSGDQQMYARLIQPLREAASNGFITERHNLINKMASELRANWTGPDGNIDWEQIVEHCAG